MKDTEQSIRAKKKRGTEVAPCNAQISSEALQKASSVSIDTKKETDFSWVSRTEARRTLGDIGRTMTDDALDALLAQLHVIAGTVIDISLGDIDCMFEEWLEGE